MPVSHCGGGRPATLDPGRVPNYADELVYRVADTVVLLDYPKALVLWRVLRRTASMEMLGRQAGAHRPQGCQRCATGNTRSVGPARHPGGSSQGSMTSMPVPSKSDTLRVASAAPRERQMAAISASKPAIGFPARSRVLAMMA